MRAAAVSIALLIVVPAVAAQEIKEYTVASNHKFLNGTFTLPTLHSFEFQTEPIYRAGHFFVIEYRIEALVEHNNAGTITFGLFVDDVEIEGCRFIFETVAAGGLTARVLVFNPNMGGCLSNHEFTSTGPHNHTASIKQVASTGVIGTIHSWNSNILVRIQESKPMTNFESLTGLTALEFIIFPALAFTGVFLWSRKDLGISLFGSILLLVDAALAVAFYATAQAWEGILVWALLLMLAFGYTVVRWFYELGKQMRGAGRK